MQVLRASRAEGLIESIGEQGLLDAFEFYCAKCATRIWRIDVQLADIVADLPVAYEKFYTAPEAARRCPACGTVHPGRDYAAWHAMRAKA